MTLSERAVGATWVANTKVKPKGMTAAPTLNSRGSCRAAIAEYRLGTTAGKADFLWEETHGRASVNNEMFRRVIEVQIDRYKGWQAEAQEGLASIPQGYLILVITASDICNWLAREMERNYSVAYQRKGKPSKARIFFNILVNVLLFRGTGVAYA